MGNILATQPVANFHLFVRYQTQADFETQTGENSPPFNPGRPPKYWRDSAALKSTRASIIYDVVGLKDPDTGRPFIDTLVLRKAEAATINIPPFNTESALDPEVPVPLKPLGPTQYLDFGDTPFHPVVVRDSRADALRPATYTIGDQQAIHAIAAKLGVQL
jgi:hypothetical protein